MCVHARPLRGRERTGQCLSTPDGRVIASGHCASRAATNSLTRRATSSRSARTSTVAMPAASPALRRRSARQSLCLSLSSRRGSDRRPEANVARSGSRKRVRAGDRSRRRLLSSLDGGRAALSLRRRRTRWPCRRRTSAWPRIEASAPARADARSCPSQRRARAIAINGNHASTARPGHGARLPPQERAPGGRRLAPIRCDATHGPRCGAWDSRRYLHVMSLAARAAWPHLSPGSSC